MKNITKFITESFKVKSLLNTAGGAPVIECQRATGVHVEDAFELLLPGDKESTNYVYDNKFNLKDGCLYVMYVYEYSSDAAASAEEMFGVETYVVYVHENKMTSIGKKFPEDYVK